MSHDFRQAVAIWMSLVLSSRRLRWELSLQYHCSIPEFCNPSSGLSSKTDQWLYQRSVFPLIIVYVDVIFGSAWYQYQSSLSLLRYGMENCLNTSLEHDSMWTAQSQLHWTVWSKSISYITLLDMDPAVTISMISFYILLYGPVGPISWWLDRNIPISGRIYDYILYFMYALCGPNVPPCIQFTDCTWIVRSQLFPLMKTHLLPILQWAVQVGKRAGRVGGTGSRDERMEQGGVE